MTAEMKRFLHERGITAMDVAARVGLVVPRDIYYMLSGTMRIHPRVREVLCNVYGMTEIEYTAAVPQEGMKSNAQ